MCKFDLFFSTMYFYAKLFLELSLSLKKGSEIFSWKSGIQESEIYDVSVIDRQDYYEFFVGFKSCKT